MSHLNKMACLLCYWLVTLEVSLCGADFLYKVMWVSFLVHVICLHLLSLYVNWKRKIFGKNNLERIRVICIFCIVLG